MKARHFYLVCCVLGLVLPYSQFVPWLLEHGLNVTLFFRELFANRISAFFAMDVIVSAIVLIWFIQSEGTRLRVRFLWLPTVGTLLVCFFSSRRRHTRFKCDWSSDVCSSD